jgi:ATP-dependent DNA ligase
MEVFETTCKIGTGFSEEVLKKLHEELSINVIPEPLREYSLNGF